MKRALKLLTLHYITLHYITLHFPFYRIFIKYYYILIKHNTFRKHYSIFKKNIPTQLLKAITSLEDKTHLENIITCLENIHV